MTKIDNDDFSDTDNGSTEVTKTLIPKKSNNICYISIWRIIAVITTVLVLISAVFLLRYYMRFLLLWLEHRHGIVQTVAVVSLFCLVALPISIGYLVLVCITGYLYGFSLGLPLVVFGANFGLLIAHIILKRIGHHPVVLQLTENPTAQAIKRLITGPSCFKIVLCARVTPIPFGLQNTIFALSNVNPRIYHIASLVGLFPTQILGVYLGTTLRAMQDAWEHKNFSTSAYIVITIQVDGLIKLF
ncbi:hypothetical protein HHI36_021744 [Cryptolaemus montrouzieri]|uniref:VTT domain-containing protein n=1 Tax=Cryptolaemus montrouzieri TaxID=559131 RepID=A0ABD2MXS5_9CUCU